jgi:hypothetical protein
MWVRRTTDAGYKPRVEQINDPALEPDKLGKKIEVMQVT